MRDMCSTMLESVTLCIALGALTATAHAQSQGSWTMKAPIPIARNEVAVAAVGGKVHVIGGELPLNTFAENEAYDPKTASWKTLAPMPGGRHGTAAATTGGRVYIAAGSLKPGAGQVTDQLIVFRSP